MEWSSVFINACLIYKQDYISSNIFISILSYLIICIAKIYYTNDAFYSNNISYWLLYLNRFHNKNGGPVAQWVRSLDLSPIWHGFAPSFVNYIKGCTWLASASDKVCQLLAQGLWFSPASSTTKTGRRDIAESDVRHQKFKFKINNERKNTKL
jgi:hypothetical protein